MKINNQTNGKTSTESIEVTEMQKLNEYRVLMTPVREAIIKAITECEKSEEKNKSFMHVRYALYQAIDNINTEIRIKELLAQREAKE